MPTPVLNQGSYGWKYDGTVVRDMRLVLAGDKALQASMDALPRKFQAILMKETLKDAMKKIVLPAAQADRSFQDRTGKLRRSLRVRVAKTDKGGRLPPGVMGYAVTSVKLKNLDAYYGKWVFMDAKTRGGRGASGVMNRKKKGTRTLRNALYRNSNQLFDYTYGSLKRALPRIAHEARKEGFRKELKKALAVKVKFS